MDDSYAAGLIDGDGYIGISHVKAADTYAIKVAVAMVIKSSPILDVLKQRYGGVLSPMKPETERNAPKVRWKAEGDEAYKALTAVLPYLILKKDQARIGMDLHEQIMASRAERGRSHWCPHLRRDAELAKQRIHTLNQRGPEVVPMLPDATPFAVYRWGRWWEPDEDLFGPVEYQDSWPASGQMIAGHVYQLPPPNISQPGPLLGTPRCSDGMHNPMRERENIGNPQGRLEDQVALLPTPMARDAERGQGYPDDTGRPLSETVHRLLPTPQARDGDGARQPSRAHAASRRERGHSFNMEDAIALLPTPRATDGEKGGPNQRVSSGDQMLPSAVMSLLPTPTATPYGNNQSPSPGASVRPSLDSLAPLLASGASTPPPSDAGSDC